MTYSAELPFEASVYDPDRSWRHVSPSTLFGAATLAFSLTVGAWYLDAHFGTPRTAHRTPWTAAVAHSLDALPRQNAPTFVVAAAPSPALVARNAAAPDPLLLNPAASPGAGSSSFGQTTLLGRDFAPPPSDSAASVAQHNDVAPAPGAAIPQIHDVASAPAPAQPAAVVASAPIPLPPAAARVAEATPLPTPRPRQLGVQASQSGPSRTFGRRVAQLNRPASTAPASADNRNFIEKLFGMPQQPSGPTLAYATPEDGLFGRSRAFTSGPALSSYDRWTAVYDISAHTVYLPSGARLEAHSGLGPRLDDPTSVSLRDRGATPPALYDLKPREALFHGVQALRMTAIGGGSTFGRDGLLAHTYMLGPNGDSNGCVSFKDYNAFLQAYMNGEIKRLAVVARST